ncbi:hypothetical protein IAQ61_003569 [Plenodomus lingam]|uniref:uncharacterized protein n=1 Tax=Leptosphaeria maculans TaxID=5022 RepID=UPI003321E417|nr:hypothetical protein IAQ61_003569 [Plenodomus lingam]
MVAQRRYSVTGQTPPDNAEVLKARSPKLQALDTTVAPTSCGLCCDASGTESNNNNNNSINNNNNMGVGVGVGVDMGMGMSLGMGIGTGTHTGSTNTGGTNTGTGSDDSGTEALRGRQMAHAGSTVLVRTSSKRSATQLPSPTSPTHYLPPKIARYRLAHHGESHFDLDFGLDHDHDHDFRLDTDTDSDSSTDTDGDSDATTDSSSPSLPVSVASLSDDAPRLEQLQLCAGQGVVDDYDYDDNDNDNHNLDHYHKSTNNSKIHDGDNNNNITTTDGNEDDDDNGMEDLALSPSHSRNHSLDRISLDEQHSLQTSWEAYQKAAMLTTELETKPEAQAQTQSVVESVRTPVTLLTLPPEIRHQIYRNCDNMVLHKPLVYCISTFHGEMQHALASVSRLVREEALAIFYSYNLWVIKVEFRIMYDAFQDWIIRLGPGARLLRLVNFSVRGSLFKPRRTHTQSVMLNGHLVQVTPGAAAFDNLPNLYSPPDGDASFHIDLSEKYVGGKVELLRNDGTTEAGEKAIVFLRKLVQDIWEKRQAGTLNGQDWISMVDGFITFVGGW